MTETEIIANDHAGDAQIPHQDIGDEVLRRATERCRGAVAENATTMKDYNVDCRYGRGRAGMNNVVFLFATVLLAALVVPAAESATPSTNLVAIKAGRLLDGQTYDEFPASSEKLVPDSAALLALKERLASLPTPWSSSLPHQR